MSTDTDLLMERRRARRQGLVWKIVAVVSVTALLAVASMGGSGNLDTMGGFGGLSSTETPDGPRIARVNIEGLILEDRWRDTLLTDLKEDEDVQAVIVYVNSPGGVVVGGEDLYRGLRAISDVKPVATVLGSVAASAGYMTAIAGDRVFAREGTITGSIGVLFEATEITGLMDKLGVKSELVKSAPLKAQPNPIEAFSDAGRTAIKSVVMDMYDMFVDMVVDRRPLDRKQVQALADGRIFTGRQAVQNGLVDAIGGEDQAVAWLESKRDIAPDLPVIEAKPDYPRPDFIQRLLGAAGKALVSERLTLDGLLAVWHPGI